MVKTFNLYLTLLIALLIFADSSFAAGHVRIDPLPGIDALPTEMQQQTELIPLLEGKVARGGKPTAYVCEAGLCKLPTTDLDIFVQQLNDKG